MADNFATLLSGLESPARNAMEITPHDTNDLALVTRGIYVGGAGNLKVETANGDVVTFVGLAAGMIHPIMCKQVYSTGTTATSIVGVY